MARPQTHYDILSLPPTTSTASTAALTPSLLKKAYHRALLLHHPDKAGPGAKTAAAPAFTVDQITTAYTVLSTPRLRAEYDKTLGATTNGGGGDGRVLQVVDLDDFVEKAGEGRWTRGCRCGEAEGYVVTEEDLAAGDDVVGCCGCSLWVRVGYEVLEEEEGEEEGEESPEGGK